MARLRKIEEAAAGPTHTVFIVRRPEHAEADIEQQVSAILADDPRAEPVVIATGIPRAVHVDDDWMN